MSNNAESLNLEELRIRMKDQWTSPNNEAVFMFRKDWALEAGQIIETTAPGYFPGYQSFLPKTGETDYVEVSLVERNLTGTFNASKGGSVAGPAGPKFQFYDNAIVDTKGNPYAGETRLYFAWLNSNQSGSLWQLPGHFSFYNSQGNRVHFSPIGSFYLDLESSASIPVNIKEQLPALATYPGNYQDISLFFFDPSLEV